MKRYLLDTGVAQDYVFRRGNVFATTKEHMRRGDRVGVCIPVAGELFAGMEYSATRAKNYQRLERELCDLIMWPYDLTAAREFGRIYAELRRTGRTIQQVDIQIAAIALTLNCVLVTRDSDFAAVGGLTLEDWT